MTLDPSYLTYPKRQLGYDHDLYPWSAIQNRPKLRWPGDKGVAVWFCISLEWFPLTPVDTPFRAPGHMVTPYPDYRHYTAREYGTRVGFYRLLDALAKTGVKASVAANSAIAERYPDLTADIVGAGHEIIAHSTNMNGTVTSAVPIEDERALIATSLDTIERVSGTRPSGWLSIARSQSWNTLDLLKEAGLAYTCDWVNDELPYRFNNGLVNLPLNHELSDRQVIAVQQQSADSYAEQLCDAFDWLAREAGSDGARLLPIHLTPYISALPYRIDAIEKLISDLASRAEAWVAPGNAIVETWQTQA